MISFAIVAPTWGAVNKFDGAYTGKRVLTKGSKQTCPTEDNVSVTISGEALTFTNSRLHNFTIGFEPHPDGSFNQISAGDQGAFVSIRGRIVGDAIEADGGSSSLQQRSPLSWGAIASPKGRPPSTACATSNTTVKGSLRQDCRPRSSARPLAGRAG
jgi:hypothetical protein